MKSSQDNPKTLGIEWISPGGSRERVSTPRLEDHTLLWQVELLKQEVKEKEADFLAQETQLLEEPRRLESPNSSSEALWAQETKAAQLQLRLRSTESRLEALVAEQQPGHQAHGSSWPASILSCSRPWGLPGRAGWS